MAELQKCVTFADFIRLLNAGALHQELGEELRQIAAELENFAAENGGMAKGKLSLAIEFKLKKGVYEIEADFKTMLPKTTRPRTIAWLTPDNFFTPSNPAQQDMFPRGIANAYENNGDIRTG